MNLLAGELEKLVSEGRNPRTLDLDLLSTREIIGKINAEDGEAAIAVGREADAIASAVDRIVEAFDAGGRLVYIGAGTSGRLGVLDASECPPTFSVPPGMVVGLIAGGERALTTAVEGAEDDPALGAADLKAIGLTARDVVVGIAVSGRTPYVIGALTYAKETGAATVALSCNPSSAIAEIADISIAPVVGPEVLAGSTRLKSGTAQKLVLNMLSTASMVRIGKVYENLMVDVTVSNAKLYARAVRIVMEAADVPAETAEKLLEKTKNDVKLAILLALTDMELQEGRDLLDETGGFLRKAINQKTATSRDS
ncbi:N-acetylmuramic acid 6-phosphate etherase [Martelella lutilitoris]|uniref:N-acetylmuramic acid 6-phosphate etherase n=1 Tax=Martelella lutilitoris TaxID=2583532 RepID=A0A7T7KJV7_9HYPH|nr:N-acetylmuramic acid 6-phosphate etherase [Martelella lutilitoris]QQM28971.1 N-acetylmuramic acid 6-phosphate etherase [Martelella lutilitoris]